MTMPWSHVLLGSCLQLLGSEAAIDEAAGLPIYANGVDCSMGCTTSMVGGPVQYATDSCFLPVYLTYAPFSSLWCQSVTITGDNGPVGVSTPCATDANLVASEDAPYAIKYWYMDAMCSQWAEDNFYCTRENVCTAQDKLNGDCSCTVDEQANGECTP